jgi:pimeloyl-ACP methyl ester carboxylesterase
MESKANIVLVHGAWADGSSWSKVIPLLQEKGFNVTAAQIPLTSDVDSVEARVMAAVQKPLSITSFTAKSGSPAWKRLPSWYMVATEDQMIPPQAEEFMAKRMGATIRSVPSSHAVMLSHAKEVPDLIVLAAELIGKPAKPSRVSA